MGLVAAESPHKRTGKWMAPRGVMWDQITVTVCSSFEFDSEVVLQPEFPVVLAVNSVKPEFCLSTLR